MNLLISLFHSAPLLKIFLQHICCLRKWIQMNNLHRRMRRKDQVPIDLQEARRKQDLWAGKRETFSFLRINDIFQFASQSPHKNHRVSHVFTAFYTYSVLLPSCPPNSRSSQSHRIHGTIFFPQHVDVRDEGLHSCGPRWEKRGGKEGREEIKV